MKFAATLFILILLVAFSQFSFAQQVTTKQIPLASPGVINFASLAEHELLVPPIATTPRNMEADEEGHKGIPKKHKVDRANVTNVELPTGETRTISPSPTASFNGLTDDGTIIPPDVSGSSGPNHLMETLNSQYRIFDKTGGTVSTLSLSSFWSGVSSSGSPFCDPHVVYDPNTSKWYSVLLANLSNGHSGFFLAVSQTNDPTGSWWEYSVDAQGTGSTWMDYPAIGFNDNWIVITGNMFTTSNSFSTTKIFVFNKSSVTSGSSGTVTSFSDNTIFSLEPAVTYDAGITTEYMLTEWNNNSGGNCYVKLFTITGTQSSPSYTAGNTVGTNQPYSTSAVNAPQLGTSNKIASNDTRMRSVLYRNGLLYGAQTVFLPSSSPNRASSQVWQINPSNSSLSAFYRIDDNTASTFYSFPSVSVNSNNDVLVGYSVLSSSIYASSGYSYRTSADAANSLESNYTYKSGQASYYKTYGGSSNRWGDYSFTTVDPNDGSLWTVQEFAYTPSNIWGTVWAQVPASTSSGTCNAPTGLFASSITQTSATLTWNSASGATSYNVQYRPVSSSTWTSASSATASLAVSGLTASTQYEFQVQTVCASGNSAFTASTTFTTLSSGGIIYCASNGNSQTYEYIDNVSMGSIARTSGADAGGYYNGTALSTNVSTGSSYTLTYSAGFTGSTYTEYWAVYVDWNQDGDFADANETTFTATSTGSGNNTHSITVPSTATIGSTRMRVSMHYGSTPASCGSFDYGEVEDYTLNVSAGSSCGTPSGLSASSITSSSATLNWTAVSGATSYNVQYKLSSSGTWTTTSSATNSLSLTGLTASTSYDYQVQTVCASGNSSYSSPSSFTTSSSGGCTETYEPNNTSGTAAPISVGVDISSQISTSTDNDYYSFANTSTNHNIKITLTTLPADFDLKLYNPSGTNVKTSQNGGTTSETIIYNTSTVGTYKARVYGYAGAFSTTQCYTLHVFTSSSPFKLDDGNALAPEKDVIKVYPNPASSELTLQYDGQEAFDGTVRIMNTLGQTVSFSQQHLESGDHIQLDVSKLPNGKYFLGMNGNDFTQVKMIEVIR